MTVLSLTSHFIEGYEPRRGTRTLPIALGIHASAAVTISKTIYVTGLALFPAKTGGREFGVFREAMGWPSVEPLELTPKRSEFVVEDLLALADDEQGLLPGKYELFSRVLVFVATTTDSELELTREDFRRLDLETSRNIEISAE